MPECPRCAIPLLATDTPHGRAFACVACRGEAALLPVLRRRFAAHAVKALWGAARAARLRAGPPCPTCREAMAAVPLPGGHDGERADVCDRCHTVWFDAGEAAALPAPAPAPTPPTGAAPGPVEAARPPAPRDAPADAAADGATDETPDAHTPWVTRALALAVVLAPLLWLVLVGRDVELTRRRGLWTQELVQALGLHPGEPWRWGGLTLLTHTLVTACVEGAVVHALLLHVALAPYERARGSARALGLCLSAALVTAAALALGDAQGPARAGPSGLTAAAFAVAVLRTPGAGLSLPLASPGRRGPLGGPDLTLGIRWLAAGWVLLDLLLALEPAWPTSSPACLLPGALTGVLWWRLAERGRVLRPRRARIIGRG